MLVAVDALVGVLMSARAVVQQMAGRASTRAEAGSSGIPPPVAVIAPHPDDAALSLGCTLARLAGAGVAVSVVTCFTADAEPPLSPLAEQLHGIWGGGSDVPTLRREEEMASAQALGATAAHLDVKDAIYRRACDGEWLYCTPDAIFGRVHDADADLVFELADRVERAVPEEGMLLCPLGVGDHVDHQLAARAGDLLADRGWTVLRYAELPYALDEDALMRTLRERELELVLAHDSPTGAERDRKTEAVLAHRSQMAMIFGSLERARDRAGALGPERLFATAG
jgi:LmbE family N-acetylglucosaminyl deacetylase